MRRIFLAFFFSAFASAFAQQSPAPTSTAVPETNATVFKIGGITVDKRARAVRFPAMVQLDNGPLEYLLVTEEGKTHESLFATKISPSKLHIAMLLLGASPAQEIKELPGGQINVASLKDAPEPKGDKVEILVSWKENGQDRKVHAEEWVQNKNTQSAMTPGPWIYTSSSIFKGTFLAEEEGSIIALVTDPVALINNPRPGHNDDTTWNVLKGKVPPVNTPVEITIQFLTPSNPAKK